MCLAAKSKCCPAIHPVLIPFHSVCVSSSSLLILLPRKEKGERTLDNMKMTNFRSVSLYTNLMRSSSLPPPLIFFPSSWCHATGRWQEGGGPLDLVPLQESRGGAPSCGSFVFYTHAGSSSLRSIFFIVDLLLTSFYNYHPVSNKASTVWNGTFIVSKEENWPHSLTSLPRPLVG